jgi:hypothetical protein
MRSRLNAGREKKELESTFLHGGVAIKKTGNALHEYRLY